MTQAESARQFYDRISGVYDTLADASEHAVREKGLRLLAPRGEERLLEIGFGTGRALVEIAGRLSGGGRVSGIDVSPGMLSVAARRVRERKVAERVDLVLGDAKELPYASSSFDAAFASFTLELFAEADIGLVLGEIARVLRPQGRLGVVSMLDDGRRSTVVELYRFLHRHFPHIVDCQPIDVAGHLTRAGFGIGERDSRSIWGLPVMAVVAHLRGRERDRDRAGRTAARSPAQLNTEQTEMVAPGSCEATYSTSPATDRNRGRASDWPRSGPRRSVRGVVGRRSPSCNRIGGSKPCEGVHLCRIAEPFCSSPTTPGVRASYEISSRRAATA